MLDKLTVTGPDDKTDINDLLKLSEEFPFVEWGILVSKNSVGRSRFPSNDWQTRFVEASKDKNLNLSTHVCGNWVTELLNERWVDKGLLNVPMLKVTDRIQLNTHGIPHKYSLENFETHVAELYLLASRAKRNFIVQYDEANNEFFNELQISENFSTPNHEDYFTFNPLFDLSHGAGILPSEWPEPVARYCGYAGGLSPENFGSQAEKIVSMYSRLFEGAMPFWMDLETHVRTNEVFDIEKVYKVLKVGQEFINKQ